MKDSCKQLNKTLFKILCKKKQKKPDLIFVSSVMDFINGSIDFDRYYTVQFCSALEWIMFVFLKESKAFAF